MHQPDHLPSPRTGVCGALARIAIVFTLMALPMHAWGVMAGEPGDEAGDSPERRVDPNTKRSPWAGVGALVTGNGIFGGVLIAPRFVLTAAHVVASGQPEQVRYVLNFGRQSSQQLAALKIHLHPEFAGGTPGQLAEHDIAIVELAERAEDGVPIYPILNAPLPRGTRIWFVGYGASGFGGEGATVAGSAQSKRVGSNRIDEFVVSRANADRRIGFAFDFDGPTFESNAIGPPIASNGTLGNREESTFAIGDSGSPSFVRDRHGRWVVVGVNTFIATARGKTASTFGSIGGGMLASAYLPWIQMVVPEAVIAR